MCMRTVPNSMRVHYCLAVSASPVTSKTIVTVSPPQKKSNRKKEGEKMYKRLSKSASIAEASPKLHTCTPIEKLKTAKRDLKWVKER